MVRLARLALVALIALPAATYARHDEGPIIENSAHTLRGRELLLGPFEFGYGLGETLQIGTYTLFWALKAPNANFKWRFYETKDWAFAVRLGALYVDLTPYVDNDFKLLVVPFEAIASWRPGDWVLSAAFESVRVQADGSYDSEGSDLEGLGIATTVMFELSAEWRRSPTFAWVVEGRALVAERVEGEASTTYEITPDLSVEVYGDGEAQFERGRKANVTVSGFWSWDSFNLKLGLGTGHYNLPFVNFFTDERVSLFPELDLFWRF